MEQKGLKITAVSEVRTASDNRNYFLCTFSAGFGQKEHSIPMWEVFKRDPKTGENTQEKKWERGSPSQAKAAMEAGVLIGGRVVTNKVESYILNEGTKNERKVDTYTTIVFDDQNEIVVFANANHNIRTEEGELLGKIRAVVAPAQEAAYSDADLATEKK